MSFQSPIRLKRHSPSPAPSNYEKQTVKKAGALPNMNSAIEQMNEEFGVISRCLKAYAKQPGTKKHLSSTSLKLMQAYKNCFVSPVCPQVGELIDQVISSVMTSHLSESGQQSFKFTLGTGFRERIEQEVSLLKNNLALLEAQAQSLQVRNEAKQFCRSQELRLLQALYEEQEQTLQGILASESD